MVTNPPAGISFMEKDWDHDRGGRDQWIAWMQGVAVEALRVCTPGAHAFGVGIAANIALDGDGVGERWLGGARSGESPVGVGISEVVGCEQGDQFPWRRRYWLVWPVVTQMEGGARHYAKAGRGAVSKQEW